MKKMFGIAIIALLGLSAPAFAQNKVERTAGDAWRGTKKGAGKAWKGTKKGAKAAGNKTAEVTSKGASRVTNVKSDEWVGPEGQTIYVDDGNQYYWVNGRGKRIYVSQSALRARNQ
jgi:hypothetical protein